MPELNLPSGAACVPNIGPRERRKRVVAGLVFLAAGLGILAVLVLTGVHRLWRLTLFLPFASAAVGFFQAYEKT